MCPDSALLMNTGQKTCSAPSGGRTLVSLSPGSHSWRHSAGYLELSFCPAVLAYRCLAGGRTRHYRTPRLQGSIACALTSAHAQVWIELTQCMHCQHWKIDDTLQTHFSSFEKLHNLETMAGDFFKLLYYTRSSHCLIFKR